MNQKSLENAYSELDQSAGRVPVSRCDSYSFGTGWIQKLAKIGVALEDCLHFRDNERISPAESLDLLVELWNTRTWEDLHDCLISRVSNYFGGTISWLVGRERRVLWLGCHPLVEARYESLLKTVNGDLEDHELVQKYGDLESIPLVTPVLVGAISPGGHVANTFGREDSILRKLGIRSQVFGRCFSFFNAEFLLILNLGGSSFSEADRRNFGTLLKILRHRIQQLRKLWSERKNWWMEWGCEESQGGHFFQDVVSKKGIRLGGVPFSVGGAFTGSERRVVRLLASNASNREIAELLGISVRTAEKHVENILQKVSVRSRKRLLITLLSS